MLRAIIQLGTKRGKDKQEKEEKGARPLFSLMTRVENSRKILQKK